MANFRKKPVIIEARLLEVDSTNQQEIIDWCGGRKGLDGSVIIDTLEGSMWAVSGDWIIKGVQGEFYPCKPDIFEKTYEEVPEPTIVGAANATLTDQDLIDNPHFKDAGFKQGDSVIISEENGKLQATGVN